MTFPRPVHRARWLLPALLPLLLLALLPLTRTEPPLAHARDAVRPPGAPDVVVILTDDQRTGTISPELTPTLWHELHERGTSFTRAMVPTALCCPSRASLLSGRYGHDTGVYDNALPHGGWRPFRDGGHENRTVARALDRIGYETGLFGKYLNQFKGAASRGYVPPGWDRMVTYTTKPGYYGYALTDGAEHGWGADDYSTDVLADHVTRFIEETPADRPLFALYAPYAPHTPFTAAPGDRDALKGRLPRYRPPSVDEDVGDKPPWVRKANDGERVPQRRIDRLLRRAQESLLAVDRATGRIIDALEATGRLDDTLLVFLSDNGLMAGEHHLFRAKNFPYPGATDIPMMVRWDGRVPPGTEDDRLALNLDLPATIAEATGADVTGDGLSLLSGERRSGFPLEAVAMPGQGKRPGHPAYCGFRTSRWLFVEYATGHQELYDHRRDPHGLRNRAGDRGRAGKLAALRERARRACSPTPPGFSWAEARTARERREAADTGRTRASR